MTFEVAILILKSILLVITVILLLYSLREGNDRRKLLVEVGRATKILTRNEYFLLVVDTMLDAKVEVIGCVTGRSPKDEDDKKRVRDVINTIRKLSKEGISVKYLLPKFYDRLHIGFLYMQAGAEVLYSSCLMVHNLRFIVVDDKSVVIGIPEIIGEKEATKKGYMIPSDGLAMILKDHFYSCKNQISFAEHAKEVIKQSGAPPEHLAKELDIDEGELKKLIG